MKDRFIELVTKHEIIERCSIEFTTSNDSLFDMFSLNSYVIPIDNIEDLPDENLLKLRGILNFYIFIYLFLPLMMFVVEDILDENKEDFYCKSYIVYNDPLY